MPNNPLNLNPQPGDSVDDEDFLDVLDYLNAERQRRGDPPIKLDTTDNSGMVELQDYNNLIDGINTMSGMKPPGWTNLPLEPEGDLIHAWDIQKLVQAIDEWMGTCTCDCNYCTCDCNYCTCDCNYCTCDCDYCTCDCDYSCTCNCNYSDKRLKKEIRYF